MVWKAMNVQTVNARDLTIVAPYVRSFGNQKNGTINFIEELHPQTNPLIFVPINCRIDFSLRLRMDFNSGHNIFSANCLVLLPKEHT